MKGLEAIQIRPVQNGDLPMLMGLDHASMTDQVWQLELKRDPRGTQVTATFREVRLPRPVDLAYPNDPFALADEWKRKAMIYVALSGSEAVGYVAMTRPRTEIAWITDIVVSPKQRRRGVASAMLAAAHKWCSDEGILKIFIEMQSKNHPAMMLVHKLGYEFCGYNDQYYSTQDIAIVFVRQI